MKSGHPPGPRCAATTAHSLIPPPPHIEHRFHHTANTLHSIPDSASGFLTARASSPAQRPKTKDPAPAHWCFPSGHVRPPAPQAIRFADTKTAALHLGHKEKWAAETRCGYVAGCAAGLAALGVADVSFAPVPPELIQQIIRGQIEPNMAGTGPHPEAPAASQNLHLLPAVHRCPDDPSDYYGTHHSRLEYLRVFSWMWTCVLDM